MRSSENHLGEYLGRVNRVVDYIECNLDGSLDLKELASVANFSPFHFHRVFSSVMREPLHQFVQRIRLETAARRLLSNSRRSVTAIALDCGFRSSATFARSFKEHFLVSATEWRRRHLTPIGAIESEKCRLLSQLDRAPAPSKIYLEPQQSHPTWKFETTNDQGMLQARIEVKMQSKLNVVYVRRVGPYGQVELVPRLFEKLVGWAGSRELLAPDTRFFCIAHDNPGVTSQDNLRLSVCLTVPPGTQPEGDVGATTIPGGKCAVARFDIEPFRVAEAWEAVCGAWLPQSGFQLDDRLLYEELVKPPDPARAGKVILDICLPIRAL